MFSFDKLVELMRGHLFLPEPKFGPFQFLRATHYALRNACAQLVEVCLSLPLNIDAHAYIRHYSHITSAYRGRPCVNVHTPSHIS